MPVSRKTLTANKKTEYNKRWYENQKKTGKCTSCAKEVIPGTTRCHEHTIYTKEKYRSIMESGMCTAFNCKDLAEAGKTKCQTHLQHASKQAKVRTRELKQKVLNHYGQKCACPCECKVTNLRWLTIDHKNNNGAEHRRDNKVGTGRIFYAWIIRNGFPDDLQVLCWNCNCAKGKLGYCPHHPPEVIVPYKIHRTDTYNYSKKVDSLGRRYGQK